MEIKELRRLVYDFRAKKQKIIPVDKIQPYQYHMGFIIWRN